MLHFCVQILANTPDKIRRTEVEFYLIEGNEVISGVNSIQVMSRIIQKLGLKPIQVLLSPFSDTVTQSHFVHYH